MVDIYKQIWTSEDVIRLRNGESTTFQFNVSADEITEKRHRLFFRGESSLFYMWKSEPDCTALYLSIEDSLNREKAQKDAYCLDLSSDTEVQYPITAYKRVSWFPSLSYLPAWRYDTEEWFWGISASVKDLQISEGGYLRFRTEVCYKKDDNDAHGYFLLPDEEYTLDIEPGTYDLREYTGKLHLPKEKVDYVAFFVEGYGYSGEVYLEQPMLKMERLPHNFLPAFAPMMPSHDHFYWVGINLSKKQWPKFQIQVNGKEVCNKAFFERCHRFNEFELDLPDGSFVTGENVIDITLSKEYPLDINLKEIGYFVRDNTDLALVCSPETAIVGTEAKLLIRTKQPNTTVLLKSDTSAVTGVPQTFSEAGLNVFTLICNEPALNAEFTLECNGCCVNGLLPLIIEKEDDHILIGSGDMIYINHEDWNEIDNFFSWYNAAHVGNMLTIRNIYRWSGARRLVPEVWERLVRLLNDLGMKYVVMNDGRNLPGAYCNPTRAMMAGKGYLGSQLHERDGYLYGPTAGEVNNSDHIKRARRDLYNRVGRHDTENIQMAETYKTEIPWNGKTFINKNPYATDDMEIAAKRFVEFIKSIRGYTHRHTGITTANKYFQQAGYTWCGAETMYTNAETNGAAIRGASYGYGNPEFGAHLAVQWCSTPHNDVMHYRRFRLALYTAYMQGYTEINTEEGFWHMEEYYSAFSRNSAACKEHLKQQQDLYRYMQRNTRKGKYYSGTGIVFGRYDSWRGGGSAVWGMDSTIMSYDAPERIWHQITEEFYPLTRLSNQKLLVYMHPCPAEPVGYFSGTPYGNFDAFPIECDADKFNRYGLLAFGGYNKAEPEDCEKILAYLNQGGTVLMGWPHLSVTTKRSDVVSCNHHYIEHPFVTMLAGSKDFVVSTVNGHPVHINPSIDLSGFEIVRTTDDGLPLVIRKQLGCGTLWFFNAKEYPSVPGLWEIYREILMHCNQEQNAKENAFISCGNDVEFAVYKHDSSRSDIYLLAVDWYNASETDRHATLRVGNFEYDIAFPFGVMVKVAVDENTAAWIISEEAVVSQITDSKIVVTGSGSHMLYVYRNGEIRLHKIVFTNSSAIEIRLS